MKAVSRAIFTAVGTAAMTVPALTWQVPLPEPAVPASALTVPAAPVRDVRVDTSIQVAAVTPGAVEYAVTVRPIGGPAIGVRLVLTTVEPAAWKRPPRGCAADGSTTVLRCDLGDLTTARMLRVRVRTGGSFPAEPPVTVATSAANASERSVVELRTVQPPAVAARLTRPVPAPAVSSGAAPEPSPSASAVPSVPAASPAGGSPMAESPEVSSQPSMSPGVAAPVSPSAQATAGASPSVPATPSPSATPRTGAASGSSGPANAGSSGGSATPKTTPRRTPRMPSGGVPSGPRSRLGAPVGAPVAPASVPAAARVSVSGTPSVPGSARPSSKGGPTAKPLKSATLAQPAASAGPAVPALPADPGGPVGPIGAAGAGLGPHGATAPTPNAYGGPSPVDVGPLLPSLAPRSTVSRPEGTSELTAVTPAGSLREGRRSWTAALGIAVVVEALLLWLAGLVIVRRNHVTLRFGRRGGAVRRKAPQPTR
jgi:hypothetical protein